MNYYQTQGYAKISLNNTFNIGEKINFDFKSQKNQDRDSYIPKFESKDAALLSNSQINI